MWKLALLGLGTHSVFPHPSVLLFFRLCIEVAYPAKNLKLCFTFFQTHEFRTCCAVYKFFCILAWYTSEISVAWHPSKPNTSNSSTGFPICILVGVEKTMTFLAGKLNNHWYNTAVAPCVREVPGSAPGPGLTQAWIYHAINNFFK